MQYRVNDLSVLGFGCMRFPRKGAATDMKQTEQQIMHAIENGVNYFDTAYVYPGSEAALGKILEENGVRDKVNIATKLPHYLLKEAGDAQKYFEKELERLRTDHVDYYLMHMLPDVNVWKDLCENKHIDEWIDEKKKNGEIGKIGFSYHGGKESFKALLDVYPWEFSQIQYNYLDENSQAGREGLNYAAAKGIPVIIMEPLRGGRLATKLPKKAGNMIAKHDSRRSPAEWALKWLWDQPEVSVILSGMNSMEMLDENIRIANETEAFSMTDEEHEFINKVRDAINEKVKVGCTGCAYCMPCPAGVDIPGVFRCYETSYIDGFVTGMKEYIMCTTLRSNKSMASLCVGCGRCVSHCPQGIQIPDQLKNVKKRLEGNIYKIGAAILKKRFPY